MTQKHVNRWVNALDFVSRICRMVWFSALKLGRPNTQGWVTKGDHVGCFILDLGDKYEGTK